MTVRHPPFGRAMYRLLIPGIGLGVAAAVIAQWIIEDDILAKAAGIFLWLLIGSLALNSWLYLKRPSRREAKALGEGASFVTASLYVLIVVWIAAVVGLRFEGEDWLVVFYVASVTIPAASIVSFVVAVWPDPEPVRTYVGEAQRRRP